MTLYITVSDERPGLEKLGQTLEKFLPTFLGMFGIGNGMPFNGDKPFSEVPQGGPFTPDGQPSLPGRIVVPDGFPPIENMSREEAVGLVNSFFDFLDGKGAGPQSVTNASIETPTV